MGDTILLDLARCRSVSSSISLEMAAVGRQPRAGHIHTGQKLMPMCTQKTASQRTLAKRSTMFGSTAIAAIATATAAAAAAAAAAAGFLLLLCCQHVHNCTVTCMCIMHHTPACCCRHHMQAYTVLILRLPP